MVKKDYPDFILRFIAASAKGFYLSKEDAIAALDSAIRISSEVKDETEEGDHKMIIGLDLVNEEDAGNPLEDYADYFNSDKIRESGLNYFFHCGESLRLHPALIYLRSGLSVVLASDDAVFMMENPLVDDF